MEPAPPVSLRLRPRLPQQLLQSLEKPLDSNSERSSRDKNQRGKKRGGKKDAEKRLRPEGPDGYWLRIPLTTFSLFDLEREREEKKGGGERGGREGIVIPHDSPFPLLFAGRAGQTDRGRVMLHSRSHVAEKTGKREKKKGRRKVEYVLPYYIS